VSDCLSVDARPATLPQPAAVRVDIDGHGGEWALRPGAMHLSVDFPRLSLDGARVRLGHHDVTYQRADATTTWLDGVTVHGRTYEFPAEIEGSRTWTLQPYGFGESRAHLIDEHTGAVIGIAVHA
jgi:hypothetical protein